MALLGLAAGNYSTRTPKNTCEHDRRTFPISSLSDVTCHYTHVSCSISEGDRSPNIAVDTVSQLSLVITSCSLCRRRRFICRTQFRELAPYQEKLRYLALVFFTHFTCILECKYASKRVQICCIFIYCAHFPANLVFFQSSLHAHLSYFLRLQAIFRGQCFILLKESICICLQPGFICQATSC